MVSQCLKCRFLFFLIRKIKETKKIAVATKLNFWERREKGVPIRLFPEAKYKLLMRRIV